MKKRIVIFIILIAVLFMLVSVIILKDEVIYYFELKKEYISEYEQDVFQSCRSGEEKIFAVEKDGKFYTIPLPNGATEFG